MKLSKRGEYALRILIRLSAETLAGRPMLSIRDLADAERIPQSFLEQILLQLKKAGYLDSKRGISGGYHLARPPDTIHVGEIIRLIDGTLAPVSCVSRIAYAPCTCPDEDACGLRMLMSEVRQAMIEVLDRRTLAEVAAMTLAATPRGRSRRRSR
jgi:Rrf2 family protein